MYNNRGLRWEAKFPPSGVTILLCKFSIELLNINHFMAINQILKLLNSKRDSKYLQWREVTDWTLLFSFFFLSLPLSQLSENGVRRWIRCTLSLLWQLLPWFVPANREEERIRTRIFNAKQRPRPGPRTRRNQTREDTTWHDRTREDTTRKDKTRQGTNFEGMEDETKTSLIQRGGASRIMLPWVGLARSPDSKKSIFQRREGKAKNNLACT